MTGLPFIPFNVPSIGDEEVQEVEATLRSGWLTTGPRTTQFENEFRAYVGARHALAVNSATAGLHLALAALGVGPGDEVITTPITFCSTVQTIFHVGAKPVLADVGPDGNIDPDEIAKRINNRTRAIIPVHLAGLPCDMDAIWALARKHGVHVIEDAAHAVGAHYKGSPIGMTATDSVASSDAVVFSFYATKNLTTGEGGMIATGCDALASTIRTLTLHGTSRDAWQRYTEVGNWYYEVVAGGFKYNLSDIQSAIGIQQLRKIERFIDIRTRYAKIYNEAFAELDEVELPADNPRSRHAWHLYILRLNLNRLRIDRKQFIEELRLKNVGTSVHFIPIPLHPYFIEKGLDRYPCEHARETYPRVVSLPLYPAMTEEQVRYVARCVKQVIKSARKPKVMTSGSSSF